MCPRSFLLHPGSCLCYFLVLQGLWLPLHFPCRLCLFCYIEPEKVQGKLVLQTWASIPYALRAPSVFRSRAGEDSGASPTQMPHRTIRAVPHWWGRELCHMLKPRPVILPRVGVPQEISSTVSSTAAPVRTAFFSNTA